MEITSAYIDYLNTSTLLAPLGVPDSSNYVTQVLSSSIANLQEKIDRQIFSRESSIALSELYSQVSNLSLLADKLTATDPNSVFNDSTAQASDSSVFDAVTSLVSGINSFIDFYNNNSDYLREDLLASLNSIIADQETYLESIGITVDDYGYLQVDTNALSNAIEQDLSVVEDIFAPYDGLAEEISSYASKVVLESPLIYSKEADSLSTQFTDFIYNSSALQLKQLLAGAMLDIFV